MSSKTTPKALFLPGMGADRRLYHKMNIQGVDPLYMEWPDAGEAKNLRDYAHVVIDHMNLMGEEVILIGSSMGGMVAVEMSHILNPVHTFLLSAPASRNEFPGMLKRMRASRVHKVIGPKTLSRINRLADVVMGFSNPQDRELFYEMLEGYGPEFLHWAMRAVLEWDQKLPPRAYTQILGSEDRLFKPDKCAKKPHVIEGGGHFTTWEKPEELSKVLNAEIARIELISS